MRSLILNDCFDTEQTLGKSDFCAAFFPHCFLDSDEPIAPLLSSMGKLIRIADSVFGSRFFRTVVPV